MDAVVIWVAASPLSLGSRLGGFRGRQEGVGTGGRVTSGRMTTRWRGQDGRGTTAHRELLQNKANAIGGKLRMRVHLKYEPTNSPAFFH